MHQPPAPRKDERKTTLDGEINELGERERERRRGGGRVMNASRERKEDGWRGRNAFAMRGRERKREEREESCQPSKGLA